jgi:hypothetical protein
MLARRRVVPLYAYASLFPFGGVLLCWALFYSLRHNASRRLLTISETVIPFPENRIFAVSMNVEALVLIIV